MTQKNIIVLVVVLAALGGIAYYVLSKESTPAPMESAAQAPVEEATETEQGASNLNAACEGALAYMSFPDGASADAFVAECKDGKHPQVLQQYEAQMGSDTSVNL